MTNNYFHGEIVKSSENCEISGKHYHLLDFQMIYVLKGSLKVRYPTISDEELEFGPGDVVYQPSGLVHEATYISDGAEILELTSPPNYKTIDV
eukprot:TRINITY_DN2593_c0_g1_i1.p1 TRINITY_DN2593_c0_g1~~TRINITY_DN2593_c0_g1_i1.p1  ORF type:complete len:93 (-),score=22.91 TRINITY_DN2593_c0_g1_i1:104-382(-)